MSLPSSRSESARKSSLTLECGLPEHKTVSEMGEDADWDHVASDMNKVSVNSSPELISTPRCVHSADRDVRDLYADLSEPSYDDLVKWNQHLDHELQLADENRGRCHAELHDLTSDVSQLCSAWSRACAAAEVDCDSVKNFHFLVTDAEVDSDSRAAAHQELKTNELCNWIVALKEAIRNIGREASGDDTGGTVAHWTKVALRMCGENVVDDTDMHHDSVNWQIRYEKEHQRFEALKERFKGFRAEAERMYQPDLERKHQACQAELVKAQGHVTILEEGIKQAKDEALLWKNEALQLKDELTRREATDDEQQATDDKSIMNTIKNSNANKKGMTRNLVEQHRDLQEVGSARRAILSNETAVFQRYGGDLVQESIEDLRVRLRKRREAEAAEEALKDKVRQLRLQDKKPITGERSKDVIGQGWFARWGGYRYFDVLTEEEREVARRLWMK
jgi:hypothetical protein